MKEISVKKTKEGYLYKSKKGIWEPCKFSYTTESLEKRKEILESQDGHRIPLPNYSLGEELWNAISHGLGALFGIGVLITCVLLTAENFLDSSEFPYLLASAIVYGVSIIVLYTISCIYHALAPNRGKRVLRVLDHDMVFLLVAGTYTPMCLCALREVSLWGVIPYGGWILFAFVWACVIVGITLNSVNLEKFKVVSMILYIAVGWVIIIACNDLGNSSFGWSNFFWVLSGGIAYTIGSILYGIGAKKKWMHSVFHFFVLAASILQFIGIYFGIFANI